MKIEITLISDKQISFISKYGHAVGIWRDEILPEKKMYSVEIDVTELIKYDDITIGDGNEPRIELTSEGILISGLLIEYDANGCATLKIGDSLVEIETDFNINFSFICGQYISFIVSRIDIYDEHIL